MSRNKYGPNSQIFSSAQTPQWYSYQRHEKTADFNKIKALDHLIYTFEISLVLESLAWQVDNAHPATRPALAH